MFQISVCHQNNVSVSHTIVAFSDGQILYNGLSNQVQNIILSAGEADHDYNKCLTMTAKDAFGAESTLELKFRVSSLLHLSTLNKSVI